MLTRRIFLSAGILGLLAACGNEGNYQATLHSVNPGNRMPGRYIVVMNETTEALSTLATGIKVQNSYRHVFQGFSADLSPAQLARLRSNPAVKEIHESSMMRLNEVQSGATWGIDRLDQAQRAPDTKYGYNKGGEGVTAYVIDTGILTTHPDFEGRAIAGADVSKDKGTSYENVDGHGHGTHVSGTVGSKTYGVAKKVNLVGVKVFDHTGGETPDETVIAGIEFAIKHHLENKTIGVINMSLGGEASEVLDAAIRKAVESGITTVVAAGNDNADACKYSPAREPTAITVASMANGDKKSSFSNWGKCTTVIAPGSRILSTSKSGRTQTMDGTSMASPHVAGVAALVLSAFPEKTPADVKLFMQETALKNVVGGFNANTPNLLVNTMWNAPTSL